MNGTQKMLSPAQTGRGIFMEIFLVGQVELCYNLK